MKNIAIIPVLLSFIFGCVNSDEKVSKLEKFEEKHEPFDHFYFQRAFPDESVDYAQMHTSLDIARKWSQQRQTKSADGNWQQEGPLNIGGRINCIAIHPWDDNIIYSGTAGGGVFKTSDGGNSWAPVTDELSHLPIGHIAIDPVNPDIIYAGTGDTNIGGNVWIGNGLYKSTDGGETWNYIGLEECKIISKIRINPLNPDQIFVGTMGLPFEENTDRGLYRSNDGGLTWEQVLFVSEDSGIIDLVINPDNPAVLYAANFNRIRTNYESVASGEEAGIYKSSDGGDTWTELTNGLPTGPMSRIGLELWPGNSNVLFAKYVNSDFQLEGIYKSSNAGASFSEVNTSGIPENALGGFGWYFGKLAVSPYDQNEISVLGVDLYTTFDNGNNWQLSAPEWWEYIVHADKHAMHYLGPDEILLATDGGLYRTEDGFQTWSDIDRIPNTQFYRITSNPHQPGMVLGGAQDNGTSIGFLGDPAADWLRFWGGDGFTPIVDPVDETLFYTTTQYGNFYYIYSDLENFSDWYNLEDGLVEDERVNWDAPFIMDPANNEVLYTGTDRVYRMDGAPFGIWQPISPVLVSEDETFYDKRNISTLSVSPQNTDVVYAGTTDGLVWVSDDGGESWSDISGTLPERYITDIKASPFAGSVVFTALSGYRENDNTPHLFRSIDYGQNWVDITGDLPEMPVNHIEIYNETTYFIATDNGVYYTLNSGENWDRMGSNMPYVVVLDLHIDPTLNVLLAGTYARSMWSYDLDGFVLPTSVESAQKRVRAIRVYPNPTSELLFVDASNTSVQSWAVYGPQGNQMHSHSTSYGDDFQSIDVSDWPVGMYFLLGLDASGETIDTKKFIVE